MFGIIRYKCFYFLSLSLLFLYQHRTDIRQYEHDYVIETLTRRLSKSNGQSIDRSALQKDQMKKSSVRKKFRIRRQITWADPSSGDYDYNENNKCGAQKLERGSSSLQTMIHSSLDNIESQLNSIKNTLTTLQREQDSLRNEMNQLNRCVRSQIDTTIIHAQSSSSSSSSLLPFYITRFRLRDATDFLPTEFKQVLLVLIAHIFFHTIHKLIFATNYSQMISSNWEANSTLNLPLSNCSSPSSSPPSSTSSTTTTSPGPIDVPMSPITNTSATTLPSN